MAFEAVLFDFDGVLMQSIEDHHRSWNAIFQRFDVTIGWQEFCILEGQSLYAIARQLCANHGIKETEAEKIGRDKNQLYISSAKPRLYDSAGGILAFFLKLKIPLGLVTGAHRDRFEATVTAEFKSQFEIIITADDVTKTKPDPEPYMLASYKLSVSPKACLVIENAPLGIESAKRAGMKCLAVTTTLGRGFLEQADWILDSLDEIPQWHDQWARL